MKQLLQNWKLKALAQKIFWRMPGGIYLNAAVSRLKSGHAAEDELLKKQAPNYFKQMAKLNELGFKNDSPPSFLEIGTGWDVNVAFLARLTGFNNVTTVDAFRHLDFRQIETCIKLFPQLASEIEKFSTISSPELSQKLTEASRTSGVNFCAWSGIQYIAPISRDYSEIQSESCDVVYSTAVFEHLYLEDVVNTLKQIRRILKPDGYTTHVIDLKDHFAYFQKGLPYNNFLRFSDKQWNYWADNPMSFTNRLLASDWERLFGEAGFEILYFGDGIEQELSRLPHSQLHNQFSARSERDLTVGEVHVIARPRKL